MTHLIPRRKPNNVFDIIGYEHIYLDQKSFIQDIKNRYPNIVFFDEPKQAHFVKQPYLIVPHDEYLGFVEYYQKHILLPNRWKLNLSHIVTKHFGQEALDVFTKLQFVEKPRPKIIHPDISRRKVSPERYVCYFSRLSRSRRENDYEPKRNSRDDIQRMMLQIKKEREQIKPIINKYLIGDLSSICIQISKMK